MGWVLSASAVLTSYRNDITLPGCSGVLAWVPNWAGQPWQVFTSSH